MPTTASTGRPPPEPRQAQDNSHTETSQGAHAQCLEVYRAAASEREEASNADRDGRRVSLQPGLEGHFGGDSLALARAESQSQEAKDILEELSHAKSDQPIP